MSPDATLYADDTGVHVPHHTYLREDDGRRIQLVGMIHVAEPEFYRDVQQLLDQCADDGTTVCFESVRRSTEGQRGTYSRLERASLANMRALRHLATAIADRFGLQTQYDGITVRPGWVNTDALDVHVVRCLGPAVPALLRAVVSLTSRWNLWELLDRHLLCELADINSDAVGPGGPPGWLTGKRTILTARDAVAAHGILRQAEQRDVVATWGSAHVPGIERRLQEAGFRRVDSAWRLAVRRERRWHEMTS